MGTVIKGTIDGQWIEMPQYSWQAGRLGWHLGVEFESKWFDKDSKFYQVREWCEKQWGMTALTYRFFEGSVWFYREEDALFCKLKWS
jgi:hypothetical protein